MLRAEDAAKEDVLRACCIALKFFVHLPPELRKAHEEGGTIRELAAIRERWKERVSAPPDAASCLDDFARYGFRPGLGSGQKGSL